LFVCTTTNLPRTPAPWMNSIGRAYLTRRTVEQFNSKKLSCRSVQSYGQHKKVGKKAIPRLFQAMHRVVVERGRSQCLLKYVSTSHIRRQTLLCWPVTHETGQHENIMGNCGEAASKPLFILTHYIPRIVLARSVPW